MCLAVLASLLAACGNNGEVSALIDGQGQTYSLSVEKFGQGIVVSDLGGLSCSKAFCIANYRENSAVTLTAQPASGWKLHSWAGCDDDTDGVCTVSMGKPRTVRPTFERTTPPILQDNVIRLNDADVANIVTVQDGALIFSGRATNIANLPVGTVLVSNHGEGFARRITEVVPLPGSNITVATSLVSLEEVIKEGTIIFNRPLTNADLANMGAVDGVRYKAASVDDSPVFTFEVDIELESGIKVEGLLEIEVTPEFAIDLGLTGVQEFKAALNASVKPMLEISFPLLEISKIEKEFTLPVPPMYFIIQAGPITLVQEIKPKIRITVDSSVGVAMAGWVEVSGRAGFHYLRSAGWRALGENDLNGGFDPLEVQGDFEATVMLGPSFTTKIYGVAGPNIFVGAYASGSASYDVFKNCGTWIVSGGGRASAKIEGEILGRKIKSADFKIFDVGWVLADGEYGVCIDTEPPSRPGAPVIQEALPTSLDIRWLLATDNMLVAKYEIYRDHRLIAHTSSPYYVDTGLSPQTYYCYYVIAVDSSGNRSPESPATCGMTVPDIDDQVPTTPTDLTAQGVSSRSIRLSWSPSTDNAGAVSYQIYNAGNGDIVRVSDTTSSDISGLKPSTRYCFRVAAFDGAGNVSGLSNQACATTSDTDTYRMRIKCENASYYAVDTTVELDEDISRSVSVVGTANDYNGQLMTYVLTGNYDTVTKILNSRIDWDFEQNDCHRADVFEVNLGTSDTGDIYLNQVEECGCTAQIRFTRSETLIATREISTPMKHKVYHNNMSALSRR